MCSTRGEMRTTPSQQIVVGMIQKKRPMLTRICEDIKMNLREQQCEHEN